MLATPLRSDGPYFMCSVASGAFVATVCSGQCEPQQQSLIMACGFWTVRFRCLFRTHGLHSDALIRPILHVSAKTE